MRACNPAGPLVVHIAKLFPKSDCSAFDAFGRILSGTIKRGDRASSYCMAWTLDVLIWELTLLALVKLLCCTLRH